MKKNFSESSGFERIALTCTAISGLLLVSGVIGCIVYLLLTLASLVIVRPGELRASGDEVTWDSGGDQLEPQWSASLD